MTYVANRLLASSYRAHEKRAGITDILFGRKAEGGIYKGERVFPRGDPTNPKSWKAITKAEFEDLFEKAPGRTDVAKFERKVGEGMKELLLRRKRSMGGIAGTAVKHPVAAGAAALLIYGLLKRQQNPYLAARQQGAPYAMTPAGAF